VPVSTAIHGGEAEAAVNELVEKRFFHAILFPEKRAVITNRFLRRI